MRTPTSAARRAPATAPIHSFGAGAVHHLLEAFAGMGLSGATLCREAGLAPPPRDSGARVGVRTLLRLFTLAEARAADPLVGLHAAEHTRFGGVASFLIGTQNTVADALAMQERFQTLLLGATAMAIDPRGQRTAVILDAGSPPREVRHLTEYCIASSCRLLRWFTVHGPRPDAVHFRHDRAGEAREYERIFGCPVRFGMRENGALLARATLAEPLVSASAELAAQLERAAQAQMGARGGPVRDAVARALRGERLTRAACRRDLIARRLGISARTLQRRLEDEGTSFGEVLDETRRHAALALLADAALSIGEVGSGAGYADQFAFNKAFRRWTGRSPSAYRREHLVPAAAALAPTKRRPPSRA